MTSPENIRLPGSEYPFFHNKIPVTYGVEGFKDFISQKRFRDYTFCPFVADKGTGGWPISTSRIYMNQVLPKFLYVPVQIAKGDLRALGGLFKFVQNRDDVPAVNINQPHKSNPVLRDFYGDPEADIDSLIRDESGQLQPYDMNSAAFVDWYEQEVGNFKDKSVVMVGIGGVGEPMAKRIAARQPQQLLLMDIEDKSEFAHRLAKKHRTKVAFTDSLQQLTEDGLPNETVLINAAGKVAATEESPLRTLVQKGAPGGVFVDIRPHKYIEIVETAKHHGWNAHTGHPMNALNGYILLKGIAARIGAKVPSFDRFRQLVAGAA